MRTNLSKYAIFLSVLVCLSVFAVQAQTVSRENAINEIERLHAELKVQEEILLSVSPEDKEKFKVFLSRPNTGIFRLLPREKYDRKLNMRGDGAYYSFFLLTQEYGRGSDISLEQNKLIVGFAGANFGFMLNLGKVSLQDVTTETEGVEYMFSYKPPILIADARSEQERVRGFEITGLKYNDRQSFEIGKTFALRSINYNTSDVLVAFQIIRQDSDGSIVLIWKKLKDYEKPAINSDSER